MEIHERPSGQDGVTLLDLDGGLDHTNTEEFTRKMHDLLQKGASRVVLDLEHLNYASSLGLAALVRVHHHYAVRGGRVIFANLHTAVAAILQVSRLDRLFDLHPTVQEALAKASQPPQIHGEG